MPDRSDYGINDAGYVVDSSKLRDFPRDNEEWEGIAGTHLSYESSVFAWEQGAPTPDNWAGVTIIGQDDGTDDGAWAVEITDTDGNTYHIDLGDIYDLAWDYYDAADDYGYDIEKEIDT